MKKNLRNTYIRLGQVRLIPLNFHMLRPHREEWRDSFVNQFHDPPPVMEILCTPRGIPLSQNFVQLAPKSRIVKGINLTKVLSSVAFMNSRTPPPYSIFCRGVWCENKRPIEKSSKTAGLQLRWIAFFAKQLRIKHLRRVCDPLNDLRPPPYGIFVHSQRYTYL